MWDSFIKLLMFIVAAIWSLLMFIIMLVLFIGMILIMLSPFLLTLYLLYTGKWIIGLIVLILAILISAIIKIGT